jgi:hypothetical protein
LKALTDAWSELDGCVAADDGWTRLRITRPEEPAVYAARRTTNDNDCIMVEVSKSAIPKEWDLPPTRGLRLDTVGVVPGRTGKTRFILESEDESFSTVFKSLCLDVIPHLAEASDDKNCMHALVQRVSLWQLFMKRFGAGGPSAEQKRGLFGELWFMTQHLLPRMGADNALGCWEGPEGGDHDFVCATIAFEVKTSSSKNPDSVRISSAGQLDETGLGKLLLWVVVVSEHRQKGQTLADICNSFRAHLPQTSQAAFDDKLLLAGITKQTEESSQRVRYRVHREKAYSVSDGFPRLTPVDLPAGVGGIKYTLSLAACSPFERTAEERFPHTDIEKA